MFLWFVAEWDDMKCLFVEMSLTLFVWQLCRCVLDLSQDQTSDLILQFRYTDSIHTHTHSEHTHLWWWCLLSGHTLTWVHTLAGVCVCVVKVSERLQNCVCADHHWVSPTSTNQESSEYFLAVLMIIYVSSAVILCKSFWAGNQLKAHFYTTELMCT